MAEALSIAGVALGALPLVFMFLKSSANGLQEMKKCRKANHHITVVNWASQLETGHTSLLNTTAWLLTAAEEEYYDPTVLKKMLSLDNSASIFKDSALNGRFEVFLASSKDSFISNFKQVLSSLKELRGMLGLTEGQISIPSLNDKKDKKFLKTLSMRISVVLLEGVFDKLLADVRKATENLDRIGQQLYRLTKIRREFPPSQDVREMRLETVMKKLRNNAQDLFKAIAGSWPQNCYCAPNHNAMLSLRRKWHEDSVEKFTQPGVEISFKAERLPGIQDEIGDTSSVWSSYMLRSVAVTSHLAELDSKTTIPAQTSDVGCRSTLCAAVAEDEQSTGQLATPLKAATKFVMPMKSVLKGLRNSPNKQQKQASFLIPEPSPQRSTDCREQSDSTRPPVPDAPEITDMCRFISSGGPKQPGQCAGYLRVGSTKHELVVLKPVYSNQSLASLSSLINADVLRSRVSDRQHLGLAASLVGNAYEFHGNLFGSEWGCDTVKLIHKPSVNTQTLFIDAVIQQSPEQVAQMVTSDELVHAQAFAQPKIIRLLGNTLLPILFHPREQDEAHLSTVAFPRDVEDQEKILGRVHRDYGRWVQDALRNCFYWKPVSGKDKASEDSLDDEAFSSAVFTRIVWPIIRTFDCVEQPVLRE